MKKVIAKWLSVAGLVFLAATITRGATTSVSIPDGRDTGIDSFLTVYDMSASGAVVVGRATSVALGRGLFSFDLSSIPANAVIYSARLRLAFTGNNTDSVTTLALYRMTTGWTNQACWISPSGGAPPLWNAPGADGDYATTPSSSLASAFQGSNSGRVDFTFDNLAQDVQQWVSYPGSNRGWILTNGDEASTGSSKQVATRESLAVMGWDGAPLLDIVYEVPANATAATILDAKDTFMMSYPSEIYDNLSAWAAANVGGVSNGLYTNRMLLNFDLSSIPANAIIQSANLRLVGTGNNGDTAVTLSLYPMTTDWTSAACWFGPNGVTTPWNAPGAGSDYVTTPSSSLTSTFLGSNTSRVDFTFTNLAQDVQSWVSNPGSNKGWIVISSDEANNWKQIATRESLAAWGWDGTPLLDIVYSIDH